MLFAYEGGFFKKQGIDAQISTFPGGGAVMAWPVIAMFTECVRPADARAGSA